MLRYALPVIATLVALPVQAQTYPFSGRWDCGVAIFTFTDTVYNNGSEDLAIQNIAQEGEGYILTMADDYQIAVTLNPDGTLYWFSPASGDDFQCSAVN